MVLNYILVGCPLDYKTLKKEIRDNGLARIFLHVGRGKGGK